jgi:hypothetical protein
MKKLLLFAAVAGLGLVSASPPPKGPDNGPREMRRHYPPCSRTVTDRCIQLYERGVRGRYERDGDDYARDEHRRHRDDYAMDDRRGDRDDEAMEGHRGRRMHYAMDERRWPMDDEGMGDRRMRRLHYAMDDGRGDDDGDGDHRWCPMHHAYHGDHHGRAMAGHAPMRRMVMAARVTRVVGCRCAPAAHRQVARAAAPRQLAQRVRRAGERG